MQSAKLAYEHMNNGGSYTDFEAFGFEDRREMYLAVGKYCRKQGVELPDTSECRTETIGKEAYRLKMARLSWEAVSKVMGVSTTLARKKAIAYQEAHGLPEVTDLREAPHLADRPLVGEQAYVDKVATEDPWDVVAERNGYKSKQAAYDAAKRYANHAKLPFPPSAQESRCAS